jgi:hypothetical protein
VSISTTVYTERYIADFCERQRGEGCHGIGNQLRREEDMNARLAVQAIQTGQDPTFYLEEAGLRRATRYEYAATGDALSALQAERLAELRRRNTSSRSGASYDAFGGFAS